MAEMFMTKQEIGKITITANSSENQGLQQWSIRSPNMAGIL